MNRVDITPAAAQLLHLLKEKHGPLLFHQSGGCCDGSQPMCYRFITQSKLFTEAELLQLPPVKTLDDFL